jgi:hypothetical protein
MVLKSHLSGSDPTVTDPELYTVAFENDRVRVLEYRDAPGATTHPHRHPDSVMVTLSSFQRRVTAFDQGTAGGRSADVELAAGEVRWVGAQEHIGENTGGSDTHVFFIELKEPSSATQVGEAPLGPSAG